MSSKDPALLLQHLLNQLPEDLHDRLIIIGGQALAFWGYRYLIDELTGGQYTALSSNDLDFIGFRPDIELCANQWGVTAWYPAIGDATPNSGICYIDVDYDGTPILNSEGKPSAVEVDFLDGVHGIPPHEVLHGVNGIPERTLKRGYTRADLGGGRLVRVLSPPLCLKSRMANLNSYIPLHEHPRERLRIQVAARATREFIIEHLADGRKIARRQALAWCKYVLQVARSPLGIELWWKHGVDPLAAIPASDERLGPHFRTQPRSGSFHGKGMAPRMGLWERQVADIERRRKSFAKRRRELGLRKGPARA